MTTELIQNLTRWIVVYEGRYIILGEGEFTPEAATADEICHDRSGKRQGGVWESEDYRRRRG